MGVQSHLGHVTLLDQYDEFIDDCLPCGLDDGARGQRGESRILRISIAAPGTVAAPDRGLAGQRALHKQTKELATESAEAVAALSPSMEIALQLRLLPAEQMSQ